MKQNNNFYLTIFGSILLCFISLFFDFSFSGFLSGILYSQIIEWFVHGWIQHHPFKIFRAYRNNHTYHHKHPSEPLSVQPFSYFLIGSVFLLAPFYNFDGFFTGYFFAYIFINVIHYDLHSKDRFLSDQLWNTKYFKLIEKNHLDHHQGIKQKYTTHSVTNPYLDIIFCKLKVTKLNNWIAKNLKI